MAPKARVIHITTYGIIAPNVFFNDNKLQVASVGIFTKLHSAGFTFCFRL